MYSCKVDMCGVGGASEVSTVSRQGERMQWEISVSTADKSFCHALQVKTRFKNVYDDLWLIYGDHKCIL